MNRRGFIATLTAVIALPFAKLFPKPFGEVIIPPATYDFLGNPPIEYLKQEWLAGARLGVGCSCKNKITVEQGAYSDPPAKSVFKAWVEYCPKHGFTTDCWVCGDGTTTEVCRRNHDQFTAVDLLTSAPKTYEVTSENFRPQLTSIKDMTLSDANIVSAKKYLNI